MPLLQQMSQALSSRLNELQMEIEQSVGHAFNFNSPRSFHRCSMTS